MSEKTYYQRNRDVILNRAKDYYENNKERLREQARDKYPNLFEEEKNKKREYGKKQISQYVWRKETKIKKNIKKITVRLKSLSIIINKMVLIVYAGMLWFM